MCTSSLESVPQIWEEQRDDRFFRITATLFSTPFVDGARVLLAADDVLDEAAPACRCLVEATSLAPRTGELAQVWVRRGNSS